MTSRGGAVGEGLPLWARCVTHPPMFALFLIFTVLPFVVSKDVEVGDAEPRSSVHISQRPRCWESTCVLASNSLSFFLVGLPIYPYRSYAQSIVATSMAQLISDSQPVDFVLNADNVYFNGITDPNDSRLQSSFEEVYSFPSLRVPWYMIAGNHDHFGNVSAQIAYSRSEKSDKWTFPSLYYNISYTLADGTRIDVINIDTIQLCGNTKDIQDAGFLRMLFSLTHTPQGPANKEEADRQWDWIKNTLRNSADYVFVMGHYPVWSVSGHGPTQCLIDDLVPLLEENAVSAYFSGHDHTLQYLRKESKNHTQHFIVSGAASRMDRSVAHKDKNTSDYLLFHYPTSFNPFSQLGFSNGAFVHSRLNATAAVFDFYTGKGTRKFRVALPPRNRTRLSH